ncbi:hypothetical protein BDV98DRAFT_557302 [Pterulicium gracile]|uniref:Uncharacterized protein n=1 Tax=Pterulicium gracile TaxID=1884261 RepID=A0A5C3QYN3_9AGAR|nr:hypothetical protein BDV98DRAFT_557302 [Pterula gracilis]
MAVVDNKNKPTPRQLEEQQQPPPPYTDLPTASSTGGPSHVHSTAGPSQPLVRNAQQGPPSRPPRNGSAAGARFCKALSIAFLIWIVFSVYMGSIAKTISSYHRENRYEGTEPLPGFSNPSCADWSSDLRGESPKANGYPHASFVSYNLPLDASRHFFASRGHLASGAVKVVSSSPHLNPDHIVVDVAVYYNEPTLLDSVRACRIQQKDTYTEGVGIFTPNWYPPTHHDHLRFEMTIHVPSANSSQPLVLENFQTDMSLFAHTIDDLSGKVFFNSLELRTSKSPIAVQGIEAHVANITTSNSGITGFYTTADFLKLQNSNGPIDVDVTLKNKGKGDPNKTSLQLHNSNGHIVSTLHLTSDSDKEGTYSINAVTSNSPFKLDFVDAPKDSALELTAETSNSPGSAIMHPTYQGKFSLKSSNVSPRVEEHKRKGRTVEYSSRSGSAVEGYVTWNGEDKSRWQLGGVNLKSSNSRVTLVL